MPKTTQDQNWQGSRLQLVGVHPKNFGTRLISTTVQDSNFKFGTKLRFGK